MFRNIYLEAYKSAFYQDARLEVLLCHLNNIYSTLGSIMQDMEFMITRIVVANQKQLKVQNQIASTDRNQTKCPQYLPSMERDIFEEKEEPQAKNLKNSRDKKTYGGRATDIDSIQNDKPNLSHRAYNLEKAEIGLKNIVRESSSKVEKLNLEEPRSNQISQSKLTFDDLFRTGQPLKDPSRVTAQNVSKQSNIHQNAVNSLNSSQDFMDHLLMKTNKREPMLSFEQHKKKQTERKTN